MELIVKEIQIDKDHSGHFTLIHSDEMGNVIQILDLPSDATIPVIGEFSIEFVEDVKRMHGINIIKKSLE
jgi:hypothetical protein